MGKGGGLRTVKFNHDNLIIYQHILRMILEIVCIGVNEQILLMFLIIDTHNKFGIQLQHTLRLGARGHLYKLVQHSWWNKICVRLYRYGLPIVWYLRTAKLHLIIAI